MATASGARRFTLGFVVDGASPCTPAWGGVVDPASGHMSAEIAALRAMGGDVIVSFGGAAGTELARSCTTVASLQAAYQSIVDRHALTSIDLDIEGGAIADRASVDRRSDALASMQAAARGRGDELHVSLTLPVLPSGLTADGIYVVQSAVARGVAIDVVNIMAMDYGAGAAPHPEGQMGEYAVLAATNLHQQLASILPGTSDAERWRMVGVTPMIGQNDVLTERFYPSDAAVLRDAARARGFGRLSMWSADRDRPCPGGPQPWPSATCSSIDQALWAFTSTFLG
jgi:hypothetical protein